MDVFRNMELFVEVASSGGFRAAADRLGLPNSSVSRRIAELERDIGLRLFNRSTRRVELTEAGRLYFERCQRIANEARLAHENLSDLVQQPKGVIRASVPVDFALIYLSDLLDEFARAYPGIALHLDVSPRQSDLVAEPFDLTIRIGMPAEPNLIARKLIDVPVGLYASPVYLAAVTPPKVPQDLLSLVCLRMTDLPWVLEGPSGALKVAVQGPITANNVGLLHRLAVRNGGIVTLPMALAEPDVADGRLVPVLPQWRPTKVPVYALTETKLLPAKVRTFVDFLVARLNTVAEQNEVSSMRDHARKNTLGHNLG
jgi:DNA-binding transcriptional LysR family regulator